MQKHQPHTSHNRQAFI